MINSKRGRKALVPEERLTEVLKKYASILIVEKNKVVHKKHEIWNEIADELENKLLPETLYSIVTNNKYGIREQMTSYTDQSLNSTSESVTSANITHETSKELDSSKDPDLGEDGQYHFTFDMTVEEFESLIISVDYARRKGDSKTQKKIFLNLMNGRGLSLIKFGIRPIESVVTSLKIITLMRIKRQDH